MKKGITYDSVIAKIEEVFVKNELTHEEALTIHAMMQQKMVIDGLKKMKMM